MKKCNDLNNDVSEAALTRAAREAVAGALAGDFPIDPLIGKDLSRALSCIGSVVKRHGTLIELGIAGALVASDRFIVLPNVAIPLTKAALQLLDAKNTDVTLSKIKLSADSEADGIVNLDMVVVDPEARWAGTTRSSAAMGPPNTANAGPSCAGCARSAWCSPPSSISSATGRSRRSPAP